MVQNRIGEIRENVRRLTVLSQTISQQSFHPNLPLQSISKFVPKYLRDNDKTHLYDQTFCYFRYKEDHIDMMATVANLGFLAMKLKDYAQAEPYMLRDLTCTVNFVGDAHPVGLSIIDRTR